MKKFQLYNYTIIYIYVITLNYISHSVTQARPLRIGISTDLPYIEETVEPNRNGTLLASSSLLLHHIQAAPSPFYFSAWLDLKLQVVGELVSS